jgi:TetR/AcrR family transcriptional regulator
MPAEPATSSARDQILDAAEALFARKGFDPTTIKEIGTAAGQNPALLYYYFGNKEELYRAVLRRIVDGLIARGSAGLESARTPTDAIRALVTTQVEFLLSHPSAPKLFVREMIDHDARHAQAMILQMATGLFGRLCAVIEQGQRSGEFRTDVEARFAAVSCIAQVVYFMIARPAIGVFFGLGPDGVPDAMVRSFGSHAGEFAIQALSPRKRSA